MHTKTNWTYRRRWWYNMFCSLLSPIQGRSGDVATLYAFSFLRSTLEGSNCQPLVPPVSRPRSPVTTAGGIISNTTTRGMQRLHRVKNISYMNPTDPMPFYLSFRSYILVHDFHPPTPQCRVNIDQTPSLKTGRLTCTHIDAAWPPRHLQFT